MDDAVDTVVSETKAWKATRSNYTEAVKSAASKTVSRAKKLVASIPQTHIVERSIREQEPTVYE
jgi:hypothetical protein